MDLLFGIVESGGTKSHNVTIGFDNLHADDTTKIAGEFACDARHLNRIA